MLSSTAKFEMVHETKAIVKCAYFSQEYAVVITDNFVSGDTSFKSKNGGVLLMSDSVTDIDFLVKSQC